MSLGRLRWDDSWRTLPQWLPLTALNSSLLAGVLYGLLAWRQGTPGQALPLAVLWLALSVYLTWGHTGARASGLDLALPLPARRLWLRHLGALLLAGAVILAVSAALLWALFRRSPSPVSELHPPRLALLLGSGLLLAVALLESRQPALRQPSHGRLSRLGLLLLVLGVLLVLSRLPLIWVLVPLAAAAVLGGRTWRRLPPAFKELPFEPEPEAGEAAGGVVAARPGAGRRALWRTVYRSITWGPAKWWVMLPLLALLGVIASGSLLAELRFLYLPLGTYMLLAYLGPALHELHRLDPLPLCRRRLFAVLVLPILAAWAVGYGAGVLGGAALAAPGGPGPALGGQGPAVFPVLLAVVGVPFLLLAAVLFTSYREALGNRARQGVFWACLGTLLALVVVPFVAAVRRGVRLDELFDPLVGLVRRLGESLPGTLGAWAVSAVLLAAAYRLAEAAFQRMEVPVEPAKFTLVDWLRQKG